jgi:hypothetical protein
MSEPTPTPSEPATASGKLPWWRKVGFLAASLAILILLAETLLRAAGYEPRAAHPPMPHRDLVGDQSLKTPFPDIPYLRPPNSSFSERWPSNPRGYFEGRTNEIRYRVNSAGFRGRDFTKERTPAVRIAFLGDSFCWGVGVKQEDHFITRLADKLAAGSLFDGRFELLNFGLEGYNTRQEVALFKTIVLDYRPDVTVIWYFLNDWETGRRTAGTKRFLRGNSILRTPRRYSHLLDLLVLPLDLRIGTARMIDLYRSGYEEDNPGWQAVKSALKEFASLCRERGIVPVLAVHPVLIRLDDDYPFAELHRKVVDFAAGLGINAVDLFPAFAGRNAEELWVHPVDQHPNETAHRLAAEFFFDYLRQVLHENEAVVGGHLENCASTLH